MLEGVSGDPGTSEPDSIWRRRDPTTGKAQSICSIISDVLQYNVRQKPSRKPCLCPDELTYPQDPIPRTKRIGAQLKPIINHNSHQNPLLRLEGYTA